MPEYVYIIGLLFYAVSVASQVTACRISAKLSARTIQGLERAEAAYASELG